MNDERQIAPERLVELIDRNEAELVDVRTDEERDAGRIPGSRHVPLDSLAQQATTFDQSKTLVFYCRSGDRSGGAADAFSASGRDAYSLAGGILAWVEEGQAIEPEGGEVGHPSGLPPA
jgi:rhodanese-related sulfurtransferase